MAGILNVSPSETKVDSSPIDAATSFAACLPAATFADIDENDAQIERVTEVPDILDPEDDVNAPKPFPIITTNELPDTAALAFKMLWGRGAAKESTCDIEPKSWGTDTRTEWTWLVPEGAFTTTAESDNHKDDGAMLMPK